MSKNVPVKWPDTRAPKTCRDIVTCKRMKVSKTSNFSHIIIQSENYHRGNVDYAWKSLIIAHYAWYCQRSEKIESWLSSIIQGFFYIGKCNFKQQWPSLAFTSVPYIVMKIIGIPTVFVDSQLLADYHLHFHAYPMIQSVYAMDYCLNSENKRTRTHARAPETIYSIIF